MIYCVEDDDGIRELVVYTLNISGFSAEGFAEAEAMWKALQNEKPELIMLDIMLPGENGINILKKLKAQPSTSDIPVIMATAKGTEYDKVLGLDLGADDYLAKPFGMMEMISRVKAVLRRANPQKSSSVLKVGKIEMNLSEHTVKSAGQSVQLTLKEYELLRFLMENLNIVFSRDSLLSRIWGDEQISETRTVDVHIGTLRTKLGECGRYIETVRGVGYKMREKE